MFLLCLFYGEEVGLNARVSVIQKGKPFEITGYCVGTPAIFKNYFKGRLVAGG